MYVGPLPEGCPKPRSLPKPHSGTQASLWSVLAAGTDATRCHAGRPPYAQHWPAPTTVRSRANRLGRRSADIGRASDGTSRCAASPTAARPGRCGHRASRSLRSGRHKKAATRSASQNGRSLSVRWYRSRSGRKAIQYGKHVGPRVSKGKGSRPKEDG